MLGKALRGSNAIRRFVDAYNELAQPFAWTKTADQTLAHARFKRQTSPAT